MLSEEDRATSWRVVRHRLFFAGRITSIDAAEEDVRASLSALTGITGPEVLWSTVGADGFRVAAELIGGVRDDGSHS